MRDPCEFRAPDEPLPLESVAELRAWLDEQRFDIVAAYHAAERWPDGVEQETLYFELRHPPRFGAPPALFMAVGMELPRLFPPIDIWEPVAPHRHVGFTFLPRRLLPRVRATVPPLWGRDPAEPRAEPANVEFAYERPELPQELLTALRDELDRWHTIRALTS